MSAKGGDGKLSASGMTNNSSSPSLEHLSQAAVNVNLDSSRDDGEWEVISRKSKNKGGSSATRPWGSQNSNTKAWGHPDVVQKVGMRNNGGSGRMPGNWSAQAVDTKRPTGRGNVRPQSSNRALQSNYAAPQPVIQPPLAHGWNWQSRATAKGPEKVQKQFDDEAKNEIDVDNHVDDDDYDEDDALDDSDDELLSDDFDSDTSQKSHETRKKSRWLKKFFEILDSLAVEEINEPERQWHCPACQGGPGAIDWYRGLQPLMTHAKTKGSRRTRLHRELAELLDEELRRRGASVTPAGEAFGKWKGLDNEEKDYQIVWPPMVMVMNTKLEQDENDKWIGMGNQELLDYFNSYAAVKARHSYGPQGHRGISVLIFEASANGFLEAERLHKHFAEQGTDRNAWERRRSLFHPGGKRQLYGYMARKEDLDNFNHHSQGKSKLKYEIRSHQEMVVRQLKQMADENHQLGYYKNQMERSELQTKTVQESFEMVSEKLRKTMEESRIVMQRTRLYHEQNKEELDCQEQFFKEQIKFIHEARETKEEDFEKLQQKEREKVKQLNASASNNEEYRRRAEEIEKFIELQNQEMGDFVAERNELIKEHEDKMAAMKRRHWEEEVELEKAFDEKLASLMGKYTPDH